ncbi:MAG: YkgJ family cysteine cluster protein [Syntrophobacteraceae bacterium]
MSESQGSERQSRSARNPAEWDLETLLGNVTDFLDDVVRETDTPLPVARVRYQVEQEHAYQEMLRQWSRWTGPQRLDAWKKIPEMAERAIREVLPACVQCGECCRRGSPTLVLEDLEVLQSADIPWEKLVTLRRGEPVRSAFEDKPAILVDERIKLQERPGTRECVLFDNTTNQCMVYANRPMQCRAQACWDPQEARSLENEPYLTRRDIFKNVELLLDLMAEHDKRCAFDKLNAAFMRLAGKKDSSLEEVLQLVAFEDHFRTFFADQLKIPTENMNLVFGRSFADLVPLFGFRVQTEPDGTQCLVQEEE